MNDSESLRFSKEVLYGQIRRITDRQLRLVVYLLVDGWSLSDALDLVYKDFNTTPEGKSP